MGAGLLKGPMKEFTDFSLLFETNAVTPESFPKKIFEAV